MSCTPTPTLLKGRVCRHPWLYQALRIRQADAHRKDPIHPIAFGLYILGREFGLLSNVRDCPTEHPARKGIHRHPHRLTQIHGPRLGFGYIEGYTDAVGQSISGDSARRITEGWGRQVEARREGEAAQANAPARRGESPTTRHVAEQDPIDGAANISTDGGMMLVRGEGWKEVKLTAISAVEVRPAEERTVQEGKASRRAGDPVVTLKEHSYQAGLWDADAMALHQYAEGLRRGIDHCQRLSSVNDGALWIGRITDLNFPEAIQIVDWSHAEGKLWKVGKAVFGEQSPEARMGDSRVKNRS